MNTPRKIRRHSWDWDIRLEGVHFALGLCNPKYETVFTSIMTEFNHLETAMPHILAVLLGMADDRPAGYVYRAVRGAKGRYAVMKALPSCISSDWRTKPIT
jgi:hypothetical protein